MSHLNALAETKPGLRAGGAAIAGATDRRSRAALNLPLNREWRGPMVEAGVEAGAETGAARLARAAINRAPEWWRAWQYSGPHAQASPAGLTELATGARHT